MAKEKEVKGPPIREGDPRLSAPSLTDTAIGLSQKDGKWYVVEVKFDLTSGQAKVVDKTATESRDHAIEQFKIDVINKGVIG